MNIPPQTIKRTIDFFIGGLMSSEIIIIIVYLVSGWPNREPYPPFDMDGRLTIPTLLQAGIILSISLIFFALAIVKTKPGERPRRSFWLTVASLLLYAGLDEMFKLHLGFSGLVPIVGTKYWIGIYSFLIVSTGVVFYRDFKALWDFYRPSVILGLSGLGIAVFGAFFGEIFKYTLLPVILSQFFPDRQIVAAFADIARVAVEEGLETFGEIMILYAVLLYAAKKLKSLNHKIVNH
ncbi:hypothetical protein [[Phormidium] sp. ETS-05]|uniref:hypothetical protein n=1 Tax=[Phormidium] sp. ETS-05 TaxID=222819 RepID=UPI0018EF15BC|nr:hypothetical protein [[Phormidium] sp. ETS-05]